MPATDSVLYVHGAGSAAAYGPITNSGGTYGDAITYVGTNYVASGSGYSNIELDFGAPSTGSTYPYLAEFPSLYEKVYTFPPEVVGDGGVELGLHIIINSTFNNLTTVNFQVVTSAATAALVTSANDPIAARTLTLAQMQVAGAHYFTPVNFASVLEFLRFYAAPTGGTPTQGTIVAWFGPKTGGEQ
jgi:hypothetical protein